MGNYFCQSRLLVFANARITIGACFRDGVYGYTFADHKTASAELQTITVPILTLNVNEAEHT